MSNVARTRFREADRILEVLRGTLAVIQREHTIRDGEGRDVTAEVVEERARNATQAIVGLFRIRPRFPFVSMKVDLSAGCDCGALSRTGDV